VGFLFCLFAQGDHRFFGGGARIERHEIDAGGQGRGNKKKEAEEAETSTLLSRALPGGFFLRDLGHSLSRFSLITRRFL
jgi:hypothetical protein